MADIARVRFYRTGEVFPTRIAARATKLKVRVLNISYD